ncbi:hypothetical protein E1B28_004960 [Marasmius oreades]|uniref:Uncharacterized protein n=1 Tax=Marasmius oreades TaxID=181124 RepID=A0A9P7UZQ3_9AGAR|nr:uncharacterized protein E1B28_004960 [Marasmius oreades]KAG7097628.1 hypothetical protein E1B28_004960 [Marasmius oreades]
MQLHLFTLTFLSLFLQILASPIPQDSTSSGRITHFIERKPSGWKERWTNFLQGVVDLIYIKPPVDDGKDIFLERDLEGSIYISVPGLPPPEYSLRTPKIIGVDEQRRLVMKIAGI